MSTQKMRNQYSRIEAGKIFWLTQVETLLRIRSHLEQRLFVK
jgi:hypothetical protein